MTRKSEMILEQMRELMNALNLEMEKVEKTSEKTYQMLDIKALVDFSVRQGSDISYSTIYKWVTAGMIPSIRAGRKYLINLEDYKKFLDGFEFTELTSEPSSKNEEFRIDASDLFAA